MEQLTGEIHKVGALPIDPGSGDQIARPLFHHIGLESFKLTQKKTREAVDVKVMESLRATHPVIPLILDYTERKQLRNVWKILGNHRVFSTVLRCRSRFHPKNSKV